MNASEKANKKADCEPVKQTDPAATAHVTSHQTEMARDAVEESDKEAHIVQTVDHRVEPAGKNNPERLVDSLTAVVHENAD
ncbi:hypothetical protein O6H91_21G072700 [Diphasiastrum complanatum]|nr:hypothetical protein O6H91_21G072700 [Diphasiastrum complanatum]